MTILRRLRVGDSLDNFPGDTFNAICDAVEAFQRSGQVAPPPLPAAVVQRNMTVRIHNDTGIDLGRSAVVGLGDPIATPPTFADVVNRAPVLHAVVPDVDVHKRRFAIVPMPVPDDAGGEAVRAGFVWCQVEVQEDSHQYAQLRDGDTTKFDTAKSGPAEILWREAGASGTKWALVLVRLGLGDHFQIVRGTCVANVAAMDPVYQIENLKELEEHAALPDSPLWVVNRPAAEHSLGDEVYAIYNQGAYTIPEDPPDPEISVDWEEIPTTASDNLPPLRRFVLTANKLLTSATATAKFLDDAGDPVGSDVTLHDPVLRFSGRVADDLYAGSPAFEGIALLRRDLADVEPDRWEIIAMDALAEFITVKFYETVTAWKYVQSESNASNHWHVHEPQAVDADVTIQDDLDILPVAAQIATDQKLLARLLDPDSDPPTYLALMLARERPKRVRGTVVDPGSGFVAYAAATFQITSLSIVFGDELPTAPLTVQQTFQQGYVAGQLTEAIFNETSGNWENLPLPRKLGCHLGVDADGFEFVSVASLAGSGLSVSSGTGPGGCDQLTATGGGNLGEGYCTTITEEEEGPDLIHFDPITTDSGGQPAGYSGTSFQIMFHDIGATLRTDADWLSIADYDDTKNQIPWHQSGTFKFETTDDYDEGRERQHLQHESGQWAWRETLQWGEVTSEIGPMTAWGTWGSGNVQFKNDAGSNDGSAVAVENRFPDEFPSGTSVCCDRQFDPPRVVSGSCSTVS
jgi:hypothetical protein